MNIMIIRHSHLKMPSNAAVPKLSHVPRKRPTQKHYLNTAGDTMAFNFINTAQPPRPLPTEISQETSKNQRPATFKNNFKWLLNIAVIIISLHQHYYHCCHDFQFTNNKVCYSSLEAMTTATKATIIMATISGKSNIDNKTELLFAKVNHFKFLPVATKEQYWV